jgi:hypothetical protein
MIIAKLPMWNDKDSPKAKAKIFGSKNNVVIALCMVKENLENTPRPKLIFFLRIVK